ncbi:hypothetical protein AB0D71_29595 [Streptomyces avermitilis]|uniref:hypothetical protein n=1 Tax=Streptomyces avermitilis TaxID=33903 RepID=UPI0033E43098
MSIGQRGLLPGFLWRDDVERRCARLTGRTPRETRISAPGALARGERSSYRPSPPACALR